MFLGGVAVCITGGRASPGGAAGICQVLPGRSPDRQLASPRGATGSCQGPRQVGLAQPPRYRVRQVRERWKSTLAPGKRPRPRPCRACRSSPLSPFMALRCDRRSLGGPRRRCTCPCSPPSAASPCRASVPSCTGESCTQSRTLTFALNAATEPNRSVHRCPRLRRHEV